MSEDNRQSTIVFGMSFTCHQDSIHLEYNSWNVTQDLSHQSLKMVQGKIYSEWQPIKTELPKGCNECRKLG